MSTSLSINLRKDLHKALLDAFRTKEQLKMMVMLQLGTNLDEFANGNLSELVFDLIQWFEAQGSVRELVDGALRQNPENPKLVAMAAQFRSWLTEAASAFPLGSNYGGPVYAHARAAQFVTGPDAFRYVRMLAVLPAPVANEKGNGPPDSQVLEIGGIWSEWQIFSKAIEHSYDKIGGKSAAWAVVRLVPPTPEALRDALVPGQLGYQVLHFRCQGNTAGLILEDRLGREQLLTTSRIVETVLGTSVQLLVLNAGPTVELGRLLLENTRISCVVALHKPIDDCVASLLNECFYHSLASGTSAYDALIAAKLAILRQISTGDLPVTGDPQSLIDNIELLGDRDLLLNAEHPTAPISRIIAHPVPNNGVPFHRLSSFVDRSAELLQIANWFEQTNRCIFAIIGIGGIGKTMIALNAAFRHAHRFDAVVFVSARDNSDLGPLDVLHAVYKAVGQPVTPDDDKDPANSLIWGLNRRPVLLVLDNLESISSTEARRLAHVLEMLDPLSGSRVLMTLRPREHGQLLKLARGDHVIPTVLEHASALRLAWEESVRQQLDWAQYDQSMRLANDTSALTSLAERARLPKQLSLTEVGKLDELVELSFYHPYLIALAIGMIKSDSWPGVRSRLELLHGKEIEQALENWIGQALDDLLRRTPDCLDVFYALLVFEGSAEINCLRYVVLGKPVPADSREAIDFEDMLVSPAVDTSLVRRTGMRYDLDPTVRGYIERRRAPSTTTLTEFRFRHAEAHLTVVAGYDAAIKLRRMIYSEPLEWANVVVALKRLAVVAQQDDGAAQLLVDFVRNGRKVFPVNYDVRILQYLEVAVAAAKRMNNYRGQSDALLALADIQFYHSCYDAALVNYQTALLLCQAAEYRQGEGEALLGIGQVHRLRDDLGKESLGYLDAALELFVTIDYEEGQASVHWAVGEIWRDEDQVDAALKHYDRALYFFQRVEDRAGEAAVLGSIGDIQRIQRKLDISLSTLGRALALSRAEGDRLCEAEVLCGLGETQQWQGDYDAALTSLRSAIGIYREIGVNDYYAQHLIGDVYRVRGDYKAALSSYKVALDQCRDEGERLSEAGVIWGMGEIYRVQGEYDDAQTSYDEALDLYRAVASARGEGKVLASQGQLALASNDLAEADRLLKEATTAYQACTDQPAIAEAVSSYGWTCLKLGYIEQARLYLLQAADLFTELRQVELSERDLRAAQ